MEHAKLRKQLYYDYYVSLRIDHANAYHDNVREYKSFSLIPNPIDYMLIAFEKTSF